MWTTIGNYILLLVITLALWAVATLLLCSGAAMVSVNPKDVRKDQLHCVYFTTAVTILIWLGVYGSYKGWF